MSGTIGTRGSRVFSASATAAWPAYTSAPPPNSPVSDRDDHQRKREQEGEASGSVAEIPRQAQRPQQRFREVHSGVGQRSTSRAGVAEGRAGRQRRAAAAAEGIDANPLSRDVAQDGARDPEVQRKPGRGDDRLPAQGAPQAPHAYAAQKLTEGRHRSLARTVPRARCPHRRGHRRRVKEQETCTTGGDVGRPCRQSNTMRSRTPRLVSDANTLAFAAPLASASST